jgi:hypothetical protein
MNNGQRGRPRKVIDKDWLTEVTSPQHRLTVKRIAEGLQVSRTTVESYMEAYNIERKFTPLTDDQLEAILRKIKLTSPDAGVLTMLGHLHAMGIRIPRNRVWRMLQQFDALGVAIRRAEAVVRRNYEVPRCNHLWHFDGHHKLIDWGIVIHGGVDGYNDEVRLLIT